MANDPGGIEPTTDPARLQRFLAWVLPLFLGFSVLEGVASLVFRDLPMAAVAAVTFGYAGLLFVGRAQLRRGRVPAAVTIICGGLLVADILAALVQPTLFPILAVAPLVAVGVALPYVSTQAVRRLMLTCWGVTALVVGAGALSPVDSHLPPWVATFFLASALVTVVGVVLLLLWQFQQHLSDRLAGEQAARRLAEAARQRLMLLAEAGHHLAASLDYEATLQRVAQLAVPILADYCLVDLLGAGPELERVATAHAAHVPSDRIAVLRRNPPRLDNPHAIIGGVVRAGAPLILPAAPPDLFDQVTDDPERLATLRALAPTSLLILPLLARGRTLGALTLARVPPRRPYGPEEVTLAEEVARRAALAIDNARLYQAAQAGVRARDVFLATAAHELKTPLTIVKGYVQVLRRGAPADADPAQARVLAVLDRQCTRLTRLVEEVLEVTRVQLDRLALHPQPCDLGALAAGVVEQVQATTASHRLRFQVAGPVRVVVDPARIEQVLVNLLGNAIKFSPAGGDITTQVAEQDGEVVVSVQDHGIGISPDRQAHLFEQFYQAHAGTPYDSGGMGMGLYLSREFVVRHGGRMWFTSVEGKGSTFCFSVPVTSRRDDGEREEDGVGGGG